MNPKLIADLLEPMDMDMRKAEEFYEEERKAAANALQKFEWTEFDYNDPDTSQLNNGWYLAEIMEGPPAVVEYDHDIDAWRYWSTGSFCVVLRYISLPESGK